ncbi:MAG: SH3 domain-containing protein [Anaerolineales bacterium]|nr:SH3 domain-containing protein [Anaerolineales bacterium]
MKTNNYLKRTFWGSYILILVGLLAACSPTSSTTATATSTPFATATAAATPTPASTELAACTAVANSDVTLYSRPDLASAEFGTLSAGETAVLTGQTADGWLGFDPGVAQAANVGIFRLRWVAPDSDVTLSGGCAALTMYPSISPTACYEMAMADTTVYEQPEETAVAIATLPAGKYTAIISKTDQNWYQVDLGDGSLAEGNAGQTGWIASADVNFNGSTCTSLPGE